MIHKFLNKDLYVSSLIISLIFFLDRFSKIFIIQQDKISFGSDIFNSTYLNIVLIWNEGIAFGLFSFSEAKFYNILSLIISVIIIILVTMTLNSKGIKRYSLLMIVGGALGNLYDRLIFSAVPDFIDFHVRDFHWFIFNVADIFITIGVICLIFDEIFIERYENETN